MLRSLRRVRLVEVQLLITVLLFFAAGYLLVIATGRNANLLQLNINSVADILWPSSLPLLLYLLVSAGLSYRNPNADQLLLPLVALLSGLGLMFTARLEPVFDRIFVNDEGQPIYGAIAAKQSLFVTIGVILLVLMVFVDWDRWIFIRLFRTSMMDWLKNHRWTWMIFGLLLMLLTFAIGVDPNGSGVKVWFRLPGGFLFQPAELLKIVLVIFLASYLVEHREVVSAGYRIGRITLPPLPYLVPMVLIWGLGMGLIVMQSDLGAALLLFGIFVAMLYVATGKAWYAFGSFASFAIGAFVMYKFIGKVEERVALWLESCARLPDDSVAIRAVGWWCWRTWLGLRYAVLCASGSHRLCVFRLGRRIGLAWHRGDCAGVCVAGLSRLSHRPRYQGAVSRL